MGKHYVMDRLGVQPFFRVSPIGNLSFLMDKLAYPKGLTKLGPNY